VDPAREANLPCSHCGQNAWLTELENVPGLQIVQFRRLYVSHGALAKYPRSQSVHGAHCMSDVALHGETMYSPTGHLALHDEQLRSR